MNEEKKVESAAAPTDEHKVNEAQVIERPQSEREKALAEIVAATEGQHDADNARFAATVQVVDEDGNPVAAEPAPTEPSPPDEVPAEASPPLESAAAAPTTPAGEATFDQTKEYEVIVDGHKMMVKGDKIIEMGKRTIQKEAAADLRLRLASKILEEAQAKAATMTQGVTQQPPAAQPKDEGLNEAELAEAIQFGTKEQAAAAIKKLSAKQGQQVTPEQVMNFVRQNIRGEVAKELEFNEAAKFVGSEYGDLMANDYLKRMFFAEEDRLRRGGDQRSYKELYGAIGDDLRKAFKLVKPSASETPATTMAQRKEEKARTTPPVPRTAAARLDAPATAKPLSQLEILNDIRKARHQPTLNQ